MVTSRPGHPEWHGSDPDHQPTTGYSGADSFTFKVNDGSLDSTNATVSITVNTIYHARCQQPELSLPEDTALSTRWAAQTWRTVR